MVAAVNQAYSKFNFVKVQQSTFSFVNSELSSFYFEIVKDRLYAAGPQSMERRSVQTALYYLLHGLTTSIAPVACHLAEEIYQFSRGTDPTTTKGDSLFKQPLFCLPSYSIEPQFVTKWEAARSLRKAAYRQVQLARQEKRVVSAGDSLSKISTSKDCTEMLLKQFGPQSSLEGLTEMLVASEVELSHGTGTESFVVEGKDVEVGIEVEKARNGKCVRCWRHACVAGEELCGRCEGVVGK